METIILLFHIIIGAALIGLVLIQQGKGADMGAAFGSGASSTVFGSQGSGSFITKSTTTLAVIFFASSLVLASISANLGTQGTETILEEGAAVEQAVEKPADLPDVPAADDAGSDLPPMPADSADAPGTDNATAEPAAVQEPAPAEGTAVKE